jgi:hypothetical protein
MSCGVLSRRNLHIETGDKHQLQVEFIPMLYLVFASSLVEEDGAVMMQDSVNIKILVILS